MIGMKKLLFVAAVAVALCLLTATCLAAKAQDQRPARLRIEELPWLKIEDLANSHATVSCVQPLVPMYDRMLHTDAPNDTGTRQIPQMIHVSMKSRCLPPDMAYGVQKWKDALPDHSFYFHDDEAVDRLLQSECPEFPGLLDLMKCVRKGAMKIDVWRLLVLHRYGGIYTDIDIWPGPRINDSIQKDDTAFFVSDKWDRPSQWFMAMEPRHPIAYYSMREALKRVFELKDVHNLVWFLSQGLTPSSTDFRQHSTGLGISTLATWKTSEP